MTSRCRVPACIQLLIVSLATWIVVSGTAFPDEADVPLPDVVEFNRDVRPILADNCFVCHGPDQQKRQAGLRLDRPDGPGDAKPAGTISGVVPGRPGESDLFLRITSADESLRMPPADSGRSLTPGRIAVLQRWIEQGAEYEGHWAYQPLKRSVPPDVPALPGTPARSAGQLTGLDRFVLARLNELAQEPSAEADRATLLRRLSLDLTGLPPATAELDSFLSDASPDAWETVVDRLLSSPHFGERMAVWWLDLVRYADSVGYHADQEVSVSPYRDYVIDAFNSNKPFDEFTTEQIAGDLLPTPTQRQLVAAGYNRLGMMSGEGGVQDREYLAKYIAERVRNVSGTWLGATLGCCECHDHKYDPFTTRDFYRFEAFFADIQEQGLYAGGEGGNWGPTIRVPDPQQAAELASLDARIAELSACPQSPPEQRGAADTGSRLAELREARSQFEKGLTSMLLTVPIAPRTIRVLPRGNWMDDSGEIVLPGVPEVFGEHSAGDRRLTRLTRLDLAHWITSPRNPLTARVFVNRIWKLFFGAGLSRRVDDLGVQGDAPGHPRLLDFLAGQFIDSGWDVRALIRWILLSRTYRQSSLVRAGLLESDPDNRWLARQGRFRLDAEFVRDNALAVSGLLVRRVGGRSVRPYQPAGYWAHLNYPPRTWEDARGENLYRRSLYTHWQRQYLHPAMRAFDAPSREECVAERARSNTPLQALVLLNDPTFVEAARVFAENILRHGGRTSREQLDWACRQATARHMRPAEEHVLLELLASHRAYFATAPEAAERLLAVGTAPVDGDIDRSELAAWTSIARTLLNLHETITRN